MAKPFDPDAFLKQSAPPPPAFDPDAFLGATQYGSAVPQVTPDGQLIRQPDAIPDGRPMPPNWSKSDPTAYRLASGARDLFGPTIEGLATAGGAVLGSVLGPPGSVAGAGIGYGISQEALRGVDVLLGRAQPRTGLQTVTEPMGNVAFGAVTEAAAPKIMSLASKGIGRVIDFAKGNRADIKAANMLRQSLESGSRTAVEPMQNVLRKAPEGMTAAQATTDLKAPLWQSLNASVARQRGAVDDYANILANQQANDLADLAKFAGGDTTTQMRQTATGAKRALGAATEPAKQQALNVASDVSENIVSLRGEAATAREAATLKTQDARRMASAAEKATGAMKRLQRLKSNCQTLLKAHLSLVMLPGYVKQR